MTKGVGGPKLIWAIPRKTERFSQRIFPRANTCRCQTARCPVDVGIRSYERARSTLSSSCCSIHFLCKNFNLHLELLGNFFGVIQTGCYVGSDLTALYCIHTTKSQNFLFHCPHEINRNNQTFKYKIYILDSLSTNFSSFEACPCSLFCKSMFKLRSTAFTMFFIINRRGRRTIETLMDQLNRTIPLTVILLMAHKETT